MGFVGVCLDSWWMEALTLCGCHAAPPPADRSVLHAEWQRDLHRLLGELPRRCSLICALTWLGGLSHQEVADRLGVSLKAVEKQVTRGRRHLRGRIRRSA
jgi:RNA polymerase sigma factor (sigma-70 family)